MAAATRIAPTRLFAALAVLRVGLGAIFIAHGAQKLFVAGMAGVAGGFAQMGIPLAGIAGPAVSLLEFFGGIALVLGLLTRPTALLLAFTMLVAIVVVHLPAGFFAPNGIEFPLALMVGSVALALAGGGRFSVDALWSARRNALEPAAT